MRFITAFRHLPMILATALLSTGLMSCSESGQFLSVDLTTDYVPRVDFSEARITVRR